MKAIELFKRALSGPITRPAFVIATCFLVALLVQMICGALSSERMRVRGIDPVEYYVYLPSLFFDGDVNFFNEFFHYAPSRLKKQWVETATGYRRNPHGIGMAIAQSPFFVAAYLFLAVKSGYFPLPISLKYDPLFEQAWYAGNIAWFAFAVFLLAWWLKRFAGIKHALHIGVVFFLAAPVLYYAFPIVPMAHGVSLAAVLLVMVCVGKYEDTSRLRWSFLAGASLGFAVSVRTTNFVFAAYLVTHLFLILRNKKQTSHPPTWAAQTQWLTAPALMVMGLVLGFLPQLIVLSKVFGRLTVNPYEGESMFAPANILKVAFSTKHGFITWHPVLLLGLVGLSLAVFKKPRQSLVVPGFFAIFSLWILISASRNWWGGWSFGHRVFIEVYPFFALGFGVLVDAILKKRRRIKSATVGLFAFVAVLWNVLFMVQYKAGLIPREAELNFHQYLGQKLELLWAIPSGGPFCRADT